MPLSTLPLVLILLGPPGSGKGTQAHLLTKSLHIPHISTGDLIRKEMKENTPLGLKAKEYVDKGSLVPDSLITKMLFSRSSQKDCEKGYLLDGFPRTVSQAKTLSPHIKKTKTVVLFLDVPREEVIHRLSLRLVCKKCHSLYHETASPPKTKGKCDRCDGDLYRRSDDKKDVIEKRLDTYEKETKPLIEFYKKEKLLHTINCKEPKEKISQEIDALLKKEGLSF